MAGIPWHLPWSFQSQGSGLCSWFKNALLKKWSLLKVDNGGGEEKYGGICVLSVCLGLYSILNFLSAAASEALFLWVGHFPCCCLATSCVIGCYHDHPYLNIHHSGTWYSIFFLCEWLHLVCLYHLFSSFSQDFLSFFSPVVGAHRLIWEWEALWLIGAHRLMKKGCWIVVFTMHTHSKPVVFSL